MTVRQYKIHTNLDSPDNKIYDVTNGKLRFYAPTNLGIVIANNIWAVDGIGVKGGSNLSHPDIEFQMETFGDTLEENYRLVTDFVQDVLSHNFVTLEYTTDNFTVYADIAISEQTKTEGYGNNGTFSEKIVFNPITKWYTYDKLTFSTVDNGDVNASSKVYGHKANSSVPNLNLLEGTKDFSGTWNNSTLWADDGTYEGLKVRKRTGAQKGTYKIWIVPKSGDYTFSCYIKSSGANASVHGAFIVNGKREPDRTFGNNFDWKRDSITRTLSAGDSIIYSYEMAGSAVDSTVWVAGYKIEEGSSATPYKVAGDELEQADFKDYGTYRYDYTYFGETDVQRFSKWNIDKDIFSFVATIVPSNPAPSDLKFGLRFLDKDFNEYTAIVLEMETTPTNIQFNTDVNDEYYNAVIGSNTINQFANLDFGRFRTRQFQEGTMELIGVSAVEMSVKRKVDFI